MKIIAYSGSTFSLERGPYRAFIESGIDAHLYLGFAVTDIDKVINIGVNVTHKKDCWIYSASLLDWRSRILAYCHVGADPDAHELLSKVFRILKGCPLADYFKIDLYASDRGLVIIR